MSDQQSDSRSPLQTARILIAALAGVIVVISIVLVVQVVGQGGQSIEEVGDVNVLENSSNECVTCHENNTPGIVEQYGHSSMAAAGVSCEDCHEVEADYPGSVEHEGTHVLQQPTTAMCENCHEQEVAQFNQSRHALPSYVAYAGTEPLTEEQLDLYASIPEAQFNPDRDRNALFELEGHAVTQFACEGCHNVGKPALDGSIGECTACHLRHEFSLEQARKPETCNACHIGPDHPQWEIYQESAHGIAYATDGDNWNWEAEPGTLSVVDMPAATCATCHMSGFGGTSTTHDIGDRLSWYLAAPVSERRPAWQDNVVRMQAVCSECHNSDFIDTFYDDADELVLAINDWVIESDEIMQPLKDNGLLTPEPFDQEIDFVYFELWHHWGRTAKSGAWMQGPDYVQWHGAYEILSDLAELRAMAEELLIEAGLDPEEVYAE
ncbi:MAG: nitrate reductase [Chloroflexi bacterium]|nr:nitrate reductase [Chloroflexota bacterium]